MRIQSVLLLGLAASGALAFPFSLSSKKKDESNCMEGCVSEFLYPFVLAASQEGLRQALGAHNTTGVCMADHICRETIQTFVDEITDMVVTDRTRGNGSPGRWVEGYTGYTCDAKCLVLAAQTAAGQAGVVAMAVGQKHFYGTDQIWNRWAPRQMLELDMAMQQLKGGERLHVPFGQPAIDLNEKNFTFDQDIFRYRGTTDAPLLGKKVTRIQVQKILSFVPDFGVDTRRVDSTEKDGGLFGEGEAPGERGRNEFYEPKPETPVMRDATFEIRTTDAKHQRQGWLYFLWSLRVSEPGKAKVTPFESWRRLLRDCYSKVKVSNPAEKDHEDEIQAKDWKWSESAYGVDANQYPSTRELNTGKTLQLTQWVTDSQMTPLKDVDGKLTHQPWTTPWFFEYSFGSRRRVPIRGYMRAFTLNRRGNFSPHDLFFDQGEIRNLKDIELQPATADYTPLYAVSTDGRAFARWTREPVELGNGKMSWQVLDEERMPLWNEDGKPITIVYNKQTGLLESRYGRSLVPLDTEMQAFP